MTNNIISLLFLLCVSSSRGSEKTNQPQVQGQARQSQLRKASAGGYHFKVELRRSKISELNGWWGGTDQLSFQVLHATLDRNGKRLYLPMSTVLDLLNISVVTVKAQPHGCKIIINGGDASEAYTATISVVGDEVRERVVRDVEDVSVHRETTQYRGE